MSITDHIFNRIALRRSKRKTTVRLAAVGAVLAASAVTYHYTVHSGDTLSAIAHRECGSSGSWSSIYSQNRAVIGSNPNLIHPGERLTFKCTKATAAAALTTSLTHSITPSNAMQACIIARESGGNAQIMNSTGHYGLYQFSYSTWVAAGGSPSLFGHASASYQTTIFWAAVAKWGYTPWTPYDGC
jgi:LysM repeat protein